MKIFKTFSLKRRGDSFDPEATRRIADESETRSRRNRRTASYLPLTIILLFCASLTTRADSLDIVISVASLDPPRIRVEGKRDAGARAWSFRNVYAGAMGLAERIENFKLEDSEGRVVFVRKLAPGEYSSDSDAMRFSYEMRLNPPSNDADTARISWLTNERGLLLAGDLLPLSHKNAYVRFSLPNGWTVSTNEVAKNNIGYHIEGIEQAVFLVGRDVRSKSSRVGANDLTVAATGAWAFTDKEFERTVGDILKDYSEEFDSTPLRRVSVFVLPFPRSVSAQIWSAETRGGSVVLVSGQWPSKIAALIRLDNILAHEILHLWIPNALALEGEYDWFYEGFTLYLALRSGVKRGQLTFRDYLDGLGRAFDGYETHKGAQDISLIEASRRRWTQAQALVYQKGLLVAYLYDLTLMQRTDGKLSLEDVYRGLVKKHGLRGTRAEANSSVLSALNSVGGMQDFTERFIVKTSEISLSVEVGRFGLKMIPGGIRARVEVSDGLSRQQRELLAKLGYNEKADSRARALHEKLRKRRR